MAVISQHDVHRLQVTMDDASRMEICYRFQQLMQDLNDTLSRHSIANLIDDICKIASRHEFEDEILL